MLKDLYQDKVREMLAKEYNISNPMRIPRITKVCLNVGFKAATFDSKEIEAVRHNLSMIAGQKAVITLAKKSVSNFKVRKGFPVGCKVTLRKNRAYWFLERLIYIALPRVRDFIGIKKSQFDGNGNCSIGVSENIAFPEVDFDKNAKMWGMNINIITSSDNDKEASSLLSHLGLPLTR